MQRVVGRRSTEAQRLRVVCGDSAVPQEPRCDLGRPLRRRRRRPGRARPRADRPSSATPTSSLSWPNTSSSGAPSRQATVSPSTSTLGRRQRLVQRVDTAEQAAELEAPEDLLERRTVGRRGRRASVGSTSSGRSRRIVASTFDARAWSACSRIDLPRAGESSSACAMTSSSEPYWATSWPAVLSPIPGIPGMLSEVSPLRPMKSGTWSGRTP